MDTSFVLNDGVEIPAIGFGTYTIPADGSTYRAVRAALDAGYRHIDTAAAYFNEREVGEAVRDSGIPREEVFITTKLWLQDHGREAARDGLDACLRRLGTGYIDLFLIHQPYGDVPGAWKALEDAKRGGLVRSIGVSNMTPSIWNRFVPGFDTPPSVNQVEFNPYCQQRSLAEAMKGYGTRIEAWAPLAQARGGLLEDPAVLGIAQELGGTPAQVVLAYEVGEGAVVLPRSVNGTRMRENLGFRNVRLSGADRAALRSLDKGHGTHDPDAPGVAEFLLNAFDVHRGL